MSSLWTPEGEHRVAKDQQGGAQAGTRAGEGLGAESPGAEGPGVEGPGVEGEVSPEQLAEMARLEQELLSVPVADVIANHVYGMFQLAALHLAQRPPNLTEASLVIDALGAIVDTLGPRLGAGAPTLAEALASVRLAFVEISKAAAVGTGEANGNAP